MVFPPAYQQVLKGLPAVNYSARDIIYRPRNVRAHRVPPDGAHRHRLCADRGECGRGWGEFSRRKRPNRASRAEVQSRSAARPGGQSRRRTVDQ